MVHVERDADIKLSVVIPCYNAADTIGEQLEALSNQEWHNPWEVVVVDNGSGDNSVEVIQQYGDKIDNLVIITAFEKKGASYARNKGVEEANGALIAFCDADDVVAQNWLSAMGNALLEHDFVACKMDWDTLNDFSEETLKSKIQTDGLIDFSMVKFLQHGAGGTLGIKKYIHFEVGGYDEKLLRLQDVDYCWKVQLKGYELTFVPEAVMHYRARSTNFEIFRQEMKWAEYDVYLYEKYKHHGIPDYTLKQNIRSLYHVLLSTKQLFTSGNRKLWTIRLGLYLGRLKGMIKYRYLNVGL
jgi:glycosyltransferase involved in cell wall biosynthesis